MKWHVGTTNNKQGECLASPCITSKTQNTKGNNNVGCVFNLVCWNWMFQLLKIELELGLIFGVNFETKTKFEIFGGKIYN